MGFRDDSHSSILYFDNCPFIFRLAAYAYFFSVTFTLLQNRIPCVKQEVLEYGVQATV